MNLTLIDWRMARFCRMDDPRFFAGERDQMVLEQIVRRGIRSRRVIAALRQVPRHLFVDPADQMKAYSDGPLPIGEGQTISQPFIVALMTSLLHLGGEETVLEVGTGSGYQAAVLSLLAGWVHTIEFVEALAAQAQLRLAGLGFQRVTVHAGDGSLGFPDAAPYQGILVTAAAPRPPEPLLDQLGEGGRLVIPVGSPGEQELQVWQRAGRSFKISHAGPVAFVPLRGEFGWGREEWA